MTDRIAVNVYPFTNNGMVIVFDQFGEQMPAYQGVVEEYGQAIRRDFPNAVWHDPFDYATAARGARGGGA